MRIAVMGAGNMGKAIIGGLNKAHGNSVGLLVHDPVAQALEGLESIATIAPPSRWFSKPVDAVLLAVKPTDITVAVQECLPYLGGQTPLWISIAAGVTIEKLQSVLGPTRICRVMPNTPALIGEGISAYSLSDNCATQDSTLVETILAACGKTVKVPEKLMDTVTGLSGSGPAYVYVFIESLIEGGVTAGLPYATARELALQTVIGSAKMVQNSALEPSVLKTRVMSPGGTTVEGLAALEKNAFRYAVISAVCEASKKAAQLNK